MMCKKTLLTFLILVFLLQYALPLGLFAEEAKTDDSFFQLANFDFEKSLVEMYQQKKLLDIKYYPQLRRLVAQKVIKDSWNSNFISAWGKPEEPFMQWMEKHPHLLETYLTTIDLYYIDFTAQLRLMKKLCIEQPELVEKYPELAIAVAAVWDDPESWIFKDCRAHYKAKESTYPPINVIENFQYYANDSIPFHAKMKNLPWEFLAYVVCHKTSREERSWVWQNYTDKKMMAGKAYDDPKPIAEYDTLSQYGVYATTLMGVPYTLPNIKQRGTVCSGRTDYACCVCRTLGIPAMSCCGAPKYSLGHYWVRWIEFHEVKPNKIVFSIESCGRTKDRRDRIDLTYCPETGQHETDMDFTLCLVRAGRNLTAYRHGELLMRCYQPLVEKLDLSFDDQLDLLLKINAVAPANLKVWKEIASFGKNHQFNKAHVKQVEKLFSKMIDEFLFAPGELPKLAATILNFPEIKPQEKKLYLLLFKKLAEADRPDLVFEAAIHYSQSLFQQKQYQEAFNMLASVCLTHSDEGNYIEPVLLRLDETVSNDPLNLEKKVVPFYIDFLTKVTNRAENSRTYQVDMLKHAQTHFEKQKRYDLMDEAQKSIANFERQIREHEENTKKWIESLNK